MPQQRLLLELLIMSGELGVTGAPDGSLLWRTVNECEQARWLKLTEISPEIHKAEITGAGRMKLRQPNLTGRKAPL